MDCVSKINSILSIIYHAIYEAVCIRLHISFMRIVGICVLYLIIIFKSEVWPIVLFRVRSWNNGAHRKRGLMVTKTDLGYVVLCTSLPSVFALSLSRHFHHVLHTIAAYRYDIEATRWLLLNSDKSRLTWISHIYDIAIIFKLFSD